MVFQTSSGSWETSSTLTHWILSPSPFQVYPFFCPYLHQWNRNHWRKIRHLPISFSSSSCLHLLRQYFVPAVKYEHNIKYGATRNHPKSSFYSPLLLSSYSLVVSSAPSKDAFFPLHRSSSSHPQEWYPPNLSMLCMNIITLQVSNDQDYEETTR